MSQIYIFLPAALARVCWRGFESRLAFAIRRRYVAQAGERTILLWGLDVHFDQFTEVNDDVAADGPPSCTIATRLYRW